MGKGNHDEGREQETDNVPCRNGNPLDRFLERDRNLSSASERPGICGGREKIWKQPEVGHEAAQRRLRWLLLSIFSRRHLTPAARDFSRTRLRAEIEVAW